MRWLLTILAAVGGVIAAWALWSVVVILIYNAQDAETETLPIAVELAFAAMVAMQISGGYLAGRMTYKALTQKPEYQE